MNSGIRRVAAGVFIAFGILVLNLTWIQFVAVDRYRDDPRNARLLLARAGRERGAIVTVDGEVLAFSEAVADRPNAFVRRYPHGNLYAHVVGYSSLLFGDSGLEAAYAEDLRSKRDLTISDLIAALVGQDLRPRSLVVTLDHDLQRTALAALGGQRGAVVALRPSTGEVLAMVSSPSFDPNELVGPDAAPVRELLAADPAEPLADRTRQRTYPPGSVFKPIVVAAAVEQGVAGPETTFPDPLAVTLPGSEATIRNFDRRPCGDGISVTLRDAFRRSCNTVFADLGMTLGARTIGEQAEAFGFNDTIPFDLPVEPSVFDWSSLLDDPAALAQSAIGQRDVRATVLQMALVASAIADDGLLMTPFVVSQVVDADGNVVERTEPTLFRRTMSPATADVLTSLMEQVVASGTGTAAAIPGVRVAGKTGTAETAGAPHLWFIGFAPIDDPQIAVAVLVESGGTIGESATGGSVAAPIAREIMASLLRSGG